MPRYSADCMDDVIRTIQGMASKADYDAGLARTIRDAHFKRGQAYAYRDVAEILRNLEIKETKE